MFVYRFLADLPTDLHKFEIEEDRHIFEELRSVCHFAEEFDELKYSLKEKHSTSPLFFSRQENSRDGQQSRLFYSQRFSTREHPSTQVPTGDVHGDRLRVLLVQLSVGNRATLTDTLLSRSPEDSTSAITSANSCSTTNHRKNGRSST